MGTYIGVPAVQRPLTDIHSLLCLLELLQRHCVPLLHIHVLHRGEVREHDGRPRERLGLHEGGKDLRVMGMGCAGICLAALTCTLLLGRNSHDKGCGHLVHRLNNSHANEFGIVWYTREMEEEDIRKKTREERARKHPSGTLLRTHLCV